MASSSLSLLLTLGIFGGLLLSARASEFLKAPMEVIERISEEDIRTSLLDEVEGTLGTGSASRRLSEMKTILTPIFAALPKNEHGNLGHAAVSYALHRLFVQRHGWVIKGLSSKNGTQSPSLPAGVLADEAASYIEALFEQRLAGKGCGLNEVAVMAATLEHLIHNEADSRLGAAFDVHKLPLMSPISESDASTVLDTYMLLYIIGEDAKNMSLPLVEKLKEDMPQNYLAWKDTQKFVRDIQRSVTQNAGEVDFASLSKVVDVIADRFGSFQNLECGELKDKLVGMEYRGTGRVHLSDFYKPAVNGAWTFSESSGYLRSLGLLDESDSSQPSVMIANYVTSQTNCIVASGFYSVCCKNECEGLLSNLEANIGTYEAKPETILGLMTQSPSYGTSAIVPKLSDSLRQRLSEIASLHKGKVPLHGRLFAQWMHHVYPRECPFPHVKGTAESMSPSEFMELSSHDVIASEEEMRQFIETPGNPTQRHETHDLPVEEMTPWSDEEELFIVRPEFVHEPKSTMSPCKRSLVLLAAAGSLGFALIRTMSGLVQQLPHEKYTL